MDAIETLLMVASVPDELYGWHSNPVLSDLEAFLDKERNINAAPIDLNSLFTNVGCATEMLDQWILAHLTQYLGPSQIVVVSAHPLPGVLLHYDITVEINSNTSVY